jgi:hypothetical protein
MNARRLLLILALCTTQAGCGFAWYGTRNLLEAPLNCCDDFKERCRLDRLADQAWADVDKQQLPRPDSKFYADGFKKGFVDHLHYDGQGQPPAVPPWIYRGTDFQSPEGRFAIDDWFAGFRHGADAAALSGVRESIVVPIALPPRDPRTGLKQMPKPLPTPSAEELPAPRKAD